MAAVRRGSRWLHEAPTEEQVKEWFETQPLHPGMQHGPYMGGIVLISATEKAKVTRAKANGDTYLAEVEQVVFVPYVKVDTRIAYFRDYVRRLNGGNERGDYIGVIEPAPIPRIKAAQSAYYNENLPDGFGVMPVRNSNDSYSRFLIASYRVGIYERQSYYSRIRGEPAVPLLQGVGTKQTALARNWADDNALMKAETGAIGRALGVAGILVVGTGVATAEDMQEAQAGPTGAAGSAEGAALPAEAPDDGMSAASPEQAGPVMETPEQIDAALRERATALQRQFREDHPDRFAAYVSWWNERFQGQSLGDLSGPALNGAVVKLERDLDAASRGE